MSLHLCKDETSDAVCFPFGICSGRGVAGSWSSGF